ncbi:MAG: class I SAM-dependent methyltransferase [Dysgonamonadaceae bacterium]|jgi:2-polyprenyl-3-methyl-5-hydroxy-6-metoxy-1,4-benzoquinol methylase|nr:class I SAM-dependent methyltransferase [Dysgonamonadaceae bacterium]
MERKIQCPVCGETLNAPMFHCKDFRISGEMFGICKCPACLFGMTLPQPSPDEIGKYYQTPDYVSHSETKRGIVNKLYHLVQKTNTKNKIRLVERFLPKGGKLLDVGCGAGYFLSVCKEGGMETEGVEVDAGARSKAESRVGRAIYPSLKAAEASGKQFDVITLWHVFEHLHDVRSSFAQLKSLLKPSGLLILALPNPLSADAVHYGKHWAAYDVPRHLSHFSPQSINTLAGNHSMKLKTYAPMKFDAYYVSILSEELKGRGKMCALPLGLWQGYRSNRQARTTKNYSSVIYVYGDKG